MRLLTLVLVATAATTSSAHEDEQQDRVQREKSPILENANHIFNAIHSSMRQWGSSLNHNGMSFFVGQIPAGTELYHGQAEKDPVEGPEWFAFEPEHGIQFAWAFRPNTNSAVKELRLTKAQFATSHQIFSRHVASVKDPEFDSYRIEPGYLHTYKLLRDLHILYIDGQSAAKTDKGTLDTQDYILNRRVGSSPSANDSRASESPRTDFERAHHYCDTSKNEWNGYIDGFIRMEHGFELILCDIPGVAKATHVAKAWSGIGTEDYHNELDRMALFRAITSRYQGIGGGRVTLDYDSMVSAFAYDVDLFEGHASTMPRLRHVSQRDRDAISNDITKAVLKNSETKAPHTNWQAVADMIVDRYSETLQDLAYSAYPDDSKTDFNNKLTTLLRPFINFDARNTTAETSRCASHFLPPPPKTTTPSIAYNAISHLSSHLCTTLFTTLTSPDPLHTAQKTLQTLTTWLSWTTWKSCRPGCPAGEFCFTAIWPFGDHASHAHPYCVGRDTLWKTRDPADNYWNVFPPVKTMAAAAAGAMRTAAAGGQDVLG